MASSTAATKALVGKDVELILNDGNGILKDRSIRLTGADSIGISYVWSFRGIERDEFSPWSAVHMISFKHGPTAEHPVKTWPKKFRKVKPSATGIKVVGKMCEIIIHSVEPRSAMRHTSLKGMPTVIDDTAIQFVHKPHGQVYTSVVSLSRLVNVEYKEKKDTTPPGAAGAAARAKKNKK